MYMYIQYTRNEEFAWLGKRGEGGQLGVVGRGKRRGRGDSEGGSGEGTEGERRERGRRG